MKIENDVDNAKLTKVSEVPSIMKNAFNDKLAREVELPPPMNVVKDGVCASLVLNEAWGVFRPMTAFTATSASYTCMVNGQHIVQLPFQATVPEGVYTYTLTEDLQPTVVTIVPAHQPVLVEAQGEVTFLGSGNVSYMPATLKDDILPIATPTGIIATQNSYIHNNVIYDLQGRKIEKPVRKGLYIRGGKKVVK